MARFKAGDWVIAKSGKGDVYLINRVIPEERRSGILIAPERYDFDNGAVDIRKRARSGHHPVAQADKGYKLVR